VVSDEASTCCIVATLLWPVGGPALPEGLGRSNVRIYRCSDSLALLMSAAALKELASASPIATHNTAR
jgi:hypothetical protein